MACRLVGAKPLSEPVLVLLLIRTLGTDKRKQITREINSFSLTKMRLKMSAKCRQFCLGLKVLNKEHVIKADLCQNLVFRTTENFFFFFFFFIQQQYMYMNIKQCTNNKYK